MVAVRCLEKKRSELLNGEYQDDENDTMARRKKRHCREGRYMTTHQYRKDVPPDSNGIKRVNCRLGAVRNDGGETAPRRGGMSIPYCSPYTPPTG